MSHRTVLCAGLVCLCLMTLAACEQSQRQSEDVGTTEARFSPAWGQIREGLNPREVLTLLDEPKEVRVTRVNTYWYYSDRGADGPHVVFDTGRMTVDRWRSPR